MKRLFRTAILCLASAIMCRAASGAEPAAALPPAATEAVDFHKQVVPILSGRCAKCHANTQQKGGFSINTREAVLKGGDSGPAVVVGKSAESRLVQLVAGLNPTR
jgi:hypothetical protein